MFFDSKPKDFEPLEREQLNAMLLVWEEELFQSKMRKAYFKKEKISLPIVRNKQSKPERINQSLKTLKVCYHG